MGGGDKALLRLGGATLLDRVLARLAPQCAQIALNANGDPARFAETGLPVIADSVPGNPGPLAGILAGLDWAAAAGFDAIVTASADSPFLPSDLVSRLCHARQKEGKTIALAASCDHEGVLRTHPTFGLWPVALRGDLRTDLDSGMRKVGRWAGRHGFATASFEADPVDPFFNINTPADLATAEGLLRHF